MKEIDFLPEWYSQGKRCQSRTQKQYMALAAVFLMMVIWNAMALRSINQAHAQLELSQPQRIQAEGLAQQYRLVQNEWQERHRWLEHVQRLDTRLDVAAILSELSYCVSPDIKVMELRVVAQPLEINQSLDHPYDPVVYECLIEGMTEDPTGVGTLIEILEHSSFFDQVRLIQSSQLETEKMTRFKVAAYLCNGMMRPLIRK